MLKKFSLIFVVICLTGLMAMSIYAEQNVTVMSVWTGAEAEAFEKMVKPFEEETGIKVEFTGTRDLPAILTTRVEAGNPPDISVMPNPGQMVEFAKDGELVEDEALDDMSLVLQFSDNIVVISGCSHAGISRIIRKSVKVTGESDIRAVIGGFHLLNADEERIEKTKDEFKEFDVEKIHAGHCTGLRAECTFQKNWGTDFEKLRCGKIFKFG